MSKEAKLIRGQVRQVVKEVLAEEMQSAIYKEVIKQMSERISKIEANVKETLTLIDKRSKDISGYIVRQSTKPTLDDK